MGKKQTITLNGVQYDVNTGLPIHGISQAASEPTSKPNDTPVAERRSHTRAASATATHHQRQKSTTLKRAYVKNPVAKTPVALSPRHTTGHVAKSTHIARFAPHPQVVKRIDDISPVDHHSFDTVHSSHAAKLRSAFEAKQQSAYGDHLTPTEIKQGLIKASIAGVDKPNISQGKPSSSSKTTLKQLTKRPHRRFSTKNLVIACLAIALLGGYMTYVNMPGLSVQIAAAQSGIDGSYPQYQPDGYSFDGPVSYQPGEINLRFRSNGGSGGYTITQKQSSWNSVAVLDNYVAKDSDNNYDITSEGGVTIYTYDHKAVWSNGGVLYTIDSSNAPISNDQLVKIAASM